MEIRGTLLRVFESWPVEAQVSCSILLMVTAISLVGIAGGVLLALADRLVVILRGRPVEKPRDPDDDLYGLS